MMFVMFNHKRIRHLNLSLLLLITCFAIEQGRGEPVPASIVESLASEQFSDREAAQIELRNWSRKQPEKSIQELHRLALDAEDPEVRSRCWSALKDLVIEREYRSDGYLGIQMFEMPVEVPGDRKPRRAIRVDWVKPGSAAEAGGIVAGDVIIGLDDAIWREPGMNQQFGKKIAASRPGTEVRLHFLKDGKVVSKKIALGEKPLAQNPAEIDIEAANQAAKDQFFQRWLDKRGAGAR